MSIWLKNDHKMKILINFYLYLYNLFVICKLLYMFIPFIKMKLAPYCFSLVAAAILLVPSSQDVIITSPTIYN